ncbi:MAG: PadR family transcriptional regulator [Chloroflexota bacterium]|nr:PadR family transcriptional regulator [Chloroflexota bacterium]
MVKNTMKLRYLVLGLLTEKSLTGYDIKIFLESFSWLIGSPSYGSLYPTLHALRHANLVTQEVESARKIYSITAAGRQELREWTTQPLTPETSLKTFLMHLILASNYSHEALTSHLYQRQSQIEAQLNILQEMLQADQAVAETPPEPLALEYGVFMAVQELQWLANALAKLG